MKRIHLIATPRNISTALMYSFAQRQDMTVVDEPLYAHYLRFSDDDHPGKAEVLANYENDGDKVVQNIFLKKYDTPCVFFKNMGHHLAELDLSFLDKVTNFILIRNPKQLIASYAKVVNPTMQRLGLDRQYQFFKQFQKNRTKFVVMDSGELLKNPEKVLTKVCEGLEIPFDKNMLSWQAGARKEDGNWAKYWYANVHQSTGFQKQKTSERVLPKRLFPLYEEALPYYQELYEYSVKA